MLLTQKPYGKMQLKLPTTLLNPYCMLRLKPYCNMLLKPYCLAHLAPVQVASALKSTFEADTCPAGLVHAADTLWLCDSASIADFK